MRYRMLAIDLDGTLLDSRGQVPSVNRDAVRRARDAGLLVVLCTGRGYKETRRIVDALGDDHDMPLILAGGAHVTDPTTGATLHAATLEPHLTAEIIETIDPAEHAVLLLLDPDPCEHDYLVIGRNNLTDNTRWWFDFVGAEVTFADHPTMNDLHHVLRAGIVGPEAVMPPLQHRVIARFGDRVVVQHFVAVRATDGEDVHIFEVFASGVTKWSALQWLAGAHDIAEHEIAAIGDHINDVAMIAHAGCGIAMANAVDAVHKVADRQTTANDAHGVAHAIDQILHAKW